MSSNLDFAGSIESDLTRSKAWLCQNLPRKKYRNVYVLGSWYGNMGIIMSLMGVDFDCVINVDANKDYCEKTRTVYKLFGFDKKYKIVNKDCNKIDYYDADLVINTSTNDIKFHDWFAIIPPGCMVAVQCRNNQPLVANMNKPATFDEFMTMFYMQTTVCAGKLTISNQEETYDRYMIIGVK